MALAELVDIVMRASRGVAFVYASAHTLSLGPPGFEGNHSRRRSRFLASAYQAP
jgi:hypothetical protein